MCQLVPLQSRDSRHHNSWYLWNSHQKSLDTCHWRWESFVVVVVVAFLQFWEWECVSNLQLQAKQRVATVYSMWWSLCWLTACVHALGKNEQCNRKAMTLFGHLVKQQVICLKRQIERGWQKDNDRGKAEEQVRDRWGMKLNLSIQADFDKWHTDREMTRGINDQVSEWQKWLNPNFRNSVRIIK